MNDNEKYIENFVKKIPFDTPDDEHRDALKRDLLNSFPKHRLHSKNQTFNIRRIIMKNNITKFAVAAVIILAVLMAIHYSGGSIDGTSTVWANILTKVKTCRGYTYRTRGDISSFSDYAIWFRTPGHLRTDFYESEAGEIVTTWYKDLDKGTITYVHHNYKSFATYNNQAAKQQDSESIEYLLDKILSTEHKELGQKTIDGILCQGLETSDPATLGPEAEEHEDQIISMQITLWVDVQTKYPVQFEMNGSVEDKGNIIELYVIYDQFQWDVDFDPSIFEPNIPSDYRDMKPPTGN
jgi:outer membrane lipoprotein-sorting protein